MNRIVVHEQETLEDVLHDFALWLRETPFVMDEDNITSVSLGYEGDD